MTDKIIRTHRPNLCHLFLKKNLKIKQKERRRNDSTVVCVFVGKIWDFFLVTELKDSYQKNRDEYEFVSRLKGVVRLSHRKFEIACSLNGPPENNFVSDYLYLG